MSTPRTDEQAVRAVARALVNSGHRLHYVFDGEEEVAVRTAEEAVKAVMAVDEASLVVGLPDGGGISHVLFVLGNEPFECPADWGVSLSPVLDPLTEGWDE